MQQSLEQALTAAGIEAAQVAPKGGDTVGVLFKSSQLFGSGRAFLSQAGLDTFEKFYQVMDQLDPSYQFQIEGHTDNLPLGAALKATFPSNWELSVARAAAAVRYFQDSGMDPKRLSAIGYGEHKPVADNSTREGRSANRRIEVLVTPN